jgi:hypothetical protein
MWLKTAVTVTSSGISASLRTTTARNNESSICRSHTVCCDSHFS